MRTEEKNKEIVRDLFAAMDEGNLERVKKLLASDSKLYSPAVPDPVGVDELIQMIKDYSKAFPDNIHELHEIIAEGNKVAVRLVEHGTHKGEFGGMPATGRRIKLAAIHMGVIEDGKIKEWWLAEDALGQMQQLGMELKPK